MFRAGASFLFVIGVFALAEVTVYRVMQAAGLSGLPGFVLGFALFALILTAMVMLLSTINDRINNSNAMMQDHRTPR